MNYKDTLLMPKTAFEMKGKLPTKEPVIQEKWNDMQLYFKILEARKDGEQFVLHDGPPYANGDIHTGHGMNKIIKDIIVRSKGLQGYYSPYIPGWDTHGLPIETAIAKSGVDRKKLSVSEFRGLCEEYALKQVANQSQQFQRLGTLGDYGNPYLTLNKEYESIQIKIFAKMAMDGLIYRGLKPVYWSPSSETALAEAEIEYHDKEDNSVYLKFKVTDGKGIVENDASFICWTTMPWTVTGTIAVAVHERINYGLYETSKGNFILAQALAEDAFSKIEVDYKLLKEFKGSELEYIETTNPFNDVKCPVVLGDHVTTDGGTGCVTTAPGHGTEDFFTGQKYNLGLVLACDEYGKMRPEHGERIAGLYYEKANEEIIKIMEEKETMLKRLKIVHSYPHDWRTKKPIIFMATEQWFASIEMKREELLEQIEKVSWTPSWGQLRMHNMIKDRGDWCISRQRVWGVPIPVIYDENKEPLLDQSIFDHVSEKFGEFGSNYWFDSEVSDLLPESYKATHDNIDKYTKETDTMDVWFDSGSSHTSSHIARGLKYPADIYMEGSDQYRGFFNSSLIIGTCIHGQAPYKQVLSHGFLLDNKGDKMSKSIGNIIEPKTIMNQYGADIFRYWTASIDYQSDMRISPEILKQVADAYRKVRNTFKFVLGNLNDFDESKLVDYNDLKEVDKYLLVKLNKLLEKTVSAYNTYDFGVIYTSVNNFIVKELSAFYMDFAKDILYILKADDVRRRQVQTVLFHAAKTINMILAPILPHTTEEIYSFMPVSDKKESVHLELMPKPVEYSDAKEIEEKYDMFMKHREDILKAIEVAREEKIIGKSLESNIKVYFKEGYEFINDIEDLHQLYISSNVEIMDEPKGMEMETAFVEVDKFEGYTCPRCWNIVSEDRIVNDLCDRCDAVVNK